MTWNEESRGQRAVAHRRSPELLCMALLDAPPWHVGLAPVGEP